MADQRTKGFCGDGLLPVAKEYLYPGSRSAMVGIGVVGALLIGAIFYYDAAHRQGGLVASGPLSTNHATFGDDCSTCHTPFEEVSNQKCGTCHEKYGTEIGIHSFEAHYLYRTNDYTRVVPSPEEEPCSSCHTEHVGRTADLTHVADDQCQQCHEYDSFNDGHPEFEFARNNLRDPSNLAFPHTVHVNELMEREDLVDVQRSCLYCHNAEEDGRNFKPIDFEQHCSDCHLTGADATPWLQTASASGSTPGVLPAETIREQAGPGTRWAYFANPNEYQTRAGRVRKQPLYHEDPWIMENLKRLRKKLYPKGELAALLSASADVPSGEAKVLYEEALSTLRSYAEELRAQPSRQVQQELKRVKKLLAVVESRLHDPLSPLDETRFSLSTGLLNDSLSQEQVADYRRTVDQLTQACQQCHVVENATITRVQKNQDNLIRAEFNHRAHITHSNCLDCHNQIPIRQHAARNTRADSSQDHAGIYNLPPIETCQECHTRNQAANTCITCHDFHPDKSQQSNLLRYVE